MVLGDSGRHLQVFAPPFCVSPWPACNISKVPLAEDTERDLSVGMFYQLVCKESLRSDCRRRGKAIWIVVEPPSPFAIANRPLLLGLRISNFMPVPR